MKKVFVIIAGIVVAVPLCVAAQEAEGKKPTAVKVQETSAAAEQSIKDIIRNQAMEKAKETLAGQEWTVYLTAADGRGRGYETDVFTFKDGKINSQSLAKRGYAESNFSLTAQDDGLVIWETMKVNEEDGIVFLRGELRETMMKGVVSMQPKKGEKRSQYFSTVKPEMPAAPVQEKEKKADEKTKKTKGKK